MKSSKSMGRIALSMTLTSLLLAACGEKPEALLNSAKGYLAKNDSKSAVIQLKNALQTVPESPEARYLLGSALLDGGDSVAAETELRKALELKYSQDMVLPQLAKALLAQGQTKKLTDEFAKVELGQPASKANLQMTLVSAYAMQGKPALSQAALSAALQADPAFVPARVEQARQKAAQGDFEGALALVDLIIATAPASSDAWKLKGDILLYAKNQAPAALAAYRKAVEIKPNFLAAESSVISLLMQQNKLPEAAQEIEQLKKLAPSHPQTRFLEAQLAFYKKDFKLARDLVQQVLGAVPDNVQGLQLAGVVEFQLNSLDQAEIYLSKAVQAAPELLLARRALVLTYLRSGQSAKAMATLLPGLNRASVDPVLLSIAGQVYLENGDLKQAETYFSLAAQQAPKDAKKRTALALTHFLSGDVDTAFVELQDIAGSDKDTTADLALISAHLRREELDKALKAIDGLERKQPDKPLAAQLKGRVLLAKKDVAGARNSFEQALKIDPSYLPAVVSLAGLDLADKKPDVAKRRFEAVLAKDPKNSQALLALAEIAANSGAGKEVVAKLMGNAVQANPADVKPRLLLIDFNLRNRDFNAASLVAHNAVAAFPADPEVLDALGRVQQASGESNQAITTFNKLAGMQPLSPQAYMRLAGVYIADKNKDSAIASLHKVLEIKPDLLEAQRALVVLNLESKNYQEALATAHTVQKQRPKEAVGYAIEGDIFAVQKKWDGAATAYRNGLKLVDSSELAIKLHSVLTSSGKGSEADALSISRQKEHPKDAAFFFYLGDGALARKDYSSAEKMYAAVVKLQSDNSVAFNNLAWVTGKLNKEGAVAYAEKANALAPNQPAFMDTLAMILSDKGDYVKAVELQKKTVALQPKNGLFKLNLARIYIRGGSQNLARGELNELKKLGDKFSEQAEVASLLKGLSTTSATN